MSRTLLLAIGALLTGCQTPFGFGGDDWDDNVDDPFGTQDTNTSELDSASTDGTGPTVLAAHAYCADGQPQGMAALIDGPNVWVTDVGFDDECGACASWTVATTPNTTDLEVSVDYVDNDAETCDCDCGVQGIEYVMTGFTDGRWTISTGADSVSFDIGLETY